MYSNIPTRGRQENRRGSGAPQARKNAQRIFAIHALASFLAEYGVDALGMLGGRAIRKVADRRTNFVAEVFLSHSHVVKVSVDGEQRHEFLDVFFDLPSASE